MLKEEIIRLYNSGVNTASISKSLVTSRFIIFKTILNSDIDLPTCKICNKRVISITNSHTMLHGVTLREYIDKYPEDRSKIKSLAWNKGQNKENNTSIAKYAATSSKRHSTKKAKRKMSLKSKQWWKDGVAKPCKEAYLKANAAWVNKIKNVNANDRSKLLRKFANAGNTAQSVIRNNNKNNLDFFKKKYPWAISAKLVNCLNCNSEFISTLNRSKNFCNPECYFDFLNSNNNPNYFIANNLKNRMKYVKCQNCKSEFISVCSKWSKKFCSNECRKSWIAKHPHYSIKGKYYSNKFNTEYYCDSTYELDFIKWCEYSDNVISLDKNFPILIYDNKKRYFPDFFINDSIIIEIKTDHLKFYNDLDKEMTKVKRGLAENNYKLITNKELYINYKKGCINNELINDIVFNKKYFINETWENYVK